MNHQGIEDSDLVEAYVTDRLGEQARAEFEEHFVDCPECLGRVEAAQGLGAGLRALASAGEAARAPRRRWHAGAAGWVLAASRRWPSWPGASASSSGSPRRWPRSARGDGAESRARALEEQLRSAQAARPPALSTFAASGRIPVLTLARCGLRPSAAGAPRPPSRWCCWWSARAAPLRALCADPARGERSGSAAAALVPTSRDVLALGLDSNLLAPGVYVLTVDAETKDGSATPWAAIDSR